MRETGTYHILGDKHYFTPYPLPPANPPLAMSTELILSYGETMLALGQLNALSAKLPDQKRFIRAYIIKEALLSSAIEGIQTTLVDVFTHTADEDGSRPNKNTQLVMNYSQALDAALLMIQEENLPIATRVILHMHEVLMSAGDGEASSPGQFRRQSVRVGKLVPPLAPEIAELMGALEQYINLPSDLPSLIRAGLVHVQFETIHPFLDGNGRVGRLLIVLMLITNKLLDLPVLYPSYYFKKNRAEYYDRLDRVRTHGDFEGWILFYLRGIRDSALDAYQRIKDIEQLEHQLIGKIRSDAAFAKTRDTATAAINYLFTQPVTSISQMSSAIGKTHNTTQSILAKLIALGCVSTASSQKRNRLYQFDAYLTLLDNEQAGGDS